MTEVVKYAEKILDSKFCGQKLRPADIGIVSPYRGQLSKIHRALERKRLAGISVGSVEEFQGQERRVIIISTVRSDPLTLQIDRKFRIGFVKEPKVSTFLVNVFDLFLFGFLNFKIQFFVASAAL